MVTDQPKKLLNVEMKIEVVQLIKANHHDHKVHKKSPIIIKSNAHAFERPLLSKWTDNEFIYAKACPTILVFNYQEFFRRKRRRIPESHNLKNNIVHICAYLKEVIGLLLSKWTDNEFIYAKACPTILVFNYQEFFRRKKRRIPESHNLKNNIVHICAYLKEVIGNKIINLMIFIYPKDNNNNNNNNNNKKRVRDYLKKKPKKSDEVMNCQTNTDRS